MKVRVVLLVAGTEVGDTVSVPLPSAEAVTAYGADTTEVTSVEVETGLWSWQPPFPVH